MPRTLDHLDKLGDDRILTDDVTLPGEYNPHDVTLWIMGAV